MNCTLVEDWECKTMRDWKKVHDELRIRDHARHMGLSPGGDLWEKV